MEITKFNGYDLRRLNETWGGNARIIDGVNVRITPGNSIQSRPQLRLYATVAASTFGLYAVGTELRTAYPQGAGAVPRPPNGFQYDVFSDTLNVAVNITAGINSTITVTYTAATTLFPVIGTVVSGTGIPLGATVATVTPAVGFTLSVAATATNASAALTIANGVDGTNGTAVELANASLWEGRPYLVIGRRPGSVTGKNVKYEHHFMPTSPLIPVPCTVINPTTLQVANSHLAQTIAFPAVALVYGTPATLAATATSGLGIVYSVLSGPATVVGTTLTATATGTIVVQAVQAGNGTYSPAVATQTIVAYTGSPGLTSQSIAFTPVSPTGSTATLVATASSALAVTFSVVSGPATVAGTLLTFTGPGSVTVMATQAGNATYAPATDTQTVVVAVPPLVRTGSTLYFTNPGDTAARLITVSGNTLTLNAATALTGTVACMVRPYTGTKVSTPFSPGRALTLVGTKLFASNTDTNNVPFSSTINGPTDWTNPGDAGFLPTSVHIGGNQNVQGHGVFNGQLVVLYDEAMQVWKVGADPAMHTLVGNVGGAGTRMPRSIANVMGDVIYFSEGGFHSASAVITTGQLKSDDIGIMVRALTDKLDPRTQTILAGWSEALSCYYAIVDRQVFVYCLSPSSGTRDWTLWNLPWAVSDTAEVNGDLYVRRAGTGEIYVFDDAYTSEPGYAWDCTLNFLDGTNEPVRQAPNLGMKMKHWGQFRANQEGSALWQAVLDPKDILGSTVDLGTVVGSFTDIGCVYIGLNANRIAFRMSGTGYWNIDELHVQMTAGNHV